jgi:C-terminal processing protease CtpA/Prc
MIHREMCRSTLSDGPGIPPDITVPVFADRDLAAGRDPGLERARTELYRNR